MKFMFLLLSMLGCGVATAVEATARIDRPPTLDQAILVFSRVDRSEVYLGESVDLTLEYWELKIRGLTAQPLYRGSDLSLPVMAGFFVGPLQSDTEVDVRDGAEYTVTRHHQRLYPAVAGDLQIGPWRWQGTVGGYVASKLQSKSVDLSTAPLSVQVRPLPTPPSTFRGTVGEYTVKAMASSTEMTQGEPASLTIEVEGTGNPDTQEAPAVPESTWYRLGETTTEGEVTTDPATGRFAKKFRMEFMPLKPGSFQVSPVSLTYFSPAARQYKTARSDALNVRVVNSGPAEPLVVVRAGSGSAGATGLLEDGKLALAPSPSALVVRREHPGIWIGLIALPPLLWLGLFLFGGGWRLTLLGRGFLPAGNRFSHPIAALADHPEPVEALRLVVRDALMRRQGPDATGMDDRELLASLDGDVDVDSFTCIASVLQACESHRYGRAPIDQSTLVNLTRGLPEALAAVSRSPHRAEVDS